MTKCHNIVKKSLKKCKFRRQKVTNQCKKDKKNVDLSEKMPQTSIKKDTKMQN